MSVTRWAQRRRGRMWKLLPLLALAALAAGCGDDDEPTRSGSGETITYSRTGGIAGISERVTIEPDGAAKLEVGYQDPAIAEFTVSGDDLEKLQDSLAGIGDVDGPGTQTGCADCFIYALAVGDSTIEADDTNFPEELNDARSQLEEIMQRNHPGDAGPG